MFTSLNSTWSKVFISVEGSERRTAEVNSGIYGANNSKSNILFVEGTRVDGAVTLEKILSFATGTTWEPILGFSVQPSISFIVYEDRHRMYPTANTCANMLYLPYSMNESPSEYDIFEKFDNAFLSDYLGLIWTIGDK